MGLKQKLHLDSPCEVRVQGAFSRWSVKKLLDYGRQGNLSGSKCYS